jgi:DNA-binding Lrp family transcriptional regulator
LVAVKVPPPVDEATLHDTSLRVPTALRRWIVQRQVEAYVRVRAERGRARDIYEAVSDLDGYLGHALVAGRCDLIVGFGGEDFQSVADEVLSQIHELDGVDSTVTSFAFADSGDGTF